MGLLLPTRRFELATSLPPEELRAALLRVVRRAPAARDPARPARWLLGDVGEREVTLQPAPRIEDTGGRGGTWHYHSFGELVGAVVARGSGAALEGTCRVREGAGDQALLLVVGAPLAFALIAAVAFLGEARSTEALLEGVKRVATLAALPFAFFRFLVQAWFDRDVRVVEGLLREEVAASEAGRAGEAQPSRERA